MKSPPLLHGRSRVPAGALLVAIAASTLAAGCGQGERTQGGAALADAPANAGSISFELTTPSGITFTSFTYAIIGPNFSKGGNVDVSNSTTISALIDDVPPGPGYTMTLIGTAGPPKPATCSGSAPFIVAAGTVTDVSVSLACHLMTVPPPPPVPVPPYAPVVLGFVLLVLGTLAVGRRREVA